MLLLVFGSIQRIELQSVFEKKLHFLTANLCSQGHKVRYISKMGGNPFYKRSTSLFSCTNITRDVYDKYYDGKNIDETSRENKSA